MKKRTRRSIGSVILAVTLIVSMFFGCFTQKKYCAAKDYTNGGCVQWVKDRAQSVLGITLPATGMNEFGLYGANNYWRTLNYDKGSEPAKYALAVWKYNNAGANSTYGKYGHVAFVENVSGDNVTVTEGGCAGYSFEGNTGVINRTVSKAKMQTLGGCSGFYGYIYLVGGGGTQTASVSYSQLNTTFVDTWNAGLHGRIENPDRATISQVGVWIWDSAGNLVVDHKEDCGLKTSYVEQNLNIVSEAKADGLRQGETYTYQMYAVANGTTYKSGSDKFTIVDEQGPVISDVKISDVTSEGYTVSCKVTDNYMVDRVQFPTWTEAGGQDDIASDWGTNAAVTGTKDGDIYTYKVKISDHNNETGSYTTHIYAYDKYGNSSSYKDSVKAKVPEEAEYTATPKPTATVIPGKEPSSDETQSPSATPGVSATPSKAPSTTVTATPTTEPTDKPYVEPTETEKPDNEQNEQMNTVISAVSSYTKYLDFGSFELGIETDSDGSVTYQSSNSGVAKVSAYGDVILTGCGVTVITVKVAATQNYKAATKKITIKVLPASVKNFKVKAASKGKIKCTWKKTSAGNTTCQIQYSLNKQFKNAKTFSGKSSLKSGRYTGKGLKKGKYYYFRIKAVAKTGGKSYSGKWSRIIKVKVK